jgi:hypothetical protein
LNEFIPPGDGVLSQETMDEHDAAHAEMRAARADMGSNCCRDSFWEKVSIGTVKKVGYPIQREPDLACPYCVKPALMPLR